MGKFVKTIALLVLLCVAIFSCVKKDLPAPFMTNEVGGNSKPQPIIAPCDSILVLNQISTSTNIDGYNVFRVDGSLNDHFDYDEISLSHYSSSSKFYILLPNTSNYSGKKKYRLSDVSEPYKDIATLTHRTGQYFGYMTYYQASEGEIFVDYGNNKIMVSFCNVKVSTETSFHYLTGKVEVANKDN